jgi:uncharacterized lipoprotein YmbA
MTRGSARLGAPVAIGLAAWLGVALSGCLESALRRSYPVKQRYALEAPRASAVRVPLPLALRVDRVDAAPLFERVGFVYRVSDAGFERDFYHEFYAPPATLVREAALRWLEAAQAFRAAGDLHPSDADWVLRGRVNRLYADLRDRSAVRGVLDIEFFLLDGRARGGPPRLVRSYAVETAASSDHPEALVAAWSQGLRQILETLETDLHQALGSAHATGEEVPR